MGDFTYHRPASVEETTELLSSCPEGKILAGGQTLIPAIKHGLATPSDIIDLQGLKELSFIEPEADGVRVGALTPHARVAESQSSALSPLAAQIGDRHVRHWGTLGGAIVNNDPAADYPAACLALGARITTNTREIDADSFFTGLFETALEEDEWVLSVFFPKNRTAAYRKFPQPASRYALVGVFLARQEDSVRIAVTGAGAQGVFRLKDMEQALEAHWSEESITRTPIPTEDLLSDLHGDKDYRAHLIRIMAQRAFRATGG